MKASITRASASGSGGRAAVSERRSAGVGMVAVACGLWLVACGLWLVACCLWIVGGGWKLGRIFGCGLECGGVWVVREQILCVHACSGRLRHGLEISEMH